MGSGKGIRVTGESNDTKHILLFPGKGHSLPGVVSTFQLLNPSRNPFKALRSLNRSMGFFFPGVLFSGYLSIKINRSSSQRSKTSRGSIDGGSGDTHYGVTSVPSRLNTVRIKRSVHKTVLVG